MKKLLIITAIALLAITGCGKIAKMENGQDAVVVLNDGNISINDLYEKMKKDYALSSLINLIDLKILDKLYPSDDKENEYIKSQVTQVETYQKTNSAQYPTLEAFLQATYGLSDMESFKELVKLSYKRNKAIEAYAKELVTEKEIEKYYNEKTIGDMELSHILIKVEIPSSSTEEEAKKIDKDAEDKIKSIIAELKAGAKFEDLAKKYSQDGTANNGGSLGKVNREGWDKSFVEAAIKLQTGKYSEEPVKSEFGYHIILKTAQEEKPTLEKEKENIIKILADEKQNEEENIGVKALIELRKNNGIDIQDDELNKQYKNYLSRY